MVDSRADPCKWACNSAFGNDAQKRRREASCIANPIINGIPLSNFINLAPHHNDLAFRWPLSPSGFTGDKGGTGDWKPTA